MNTLLYLILGLNIGLSLTCWLASIKLRKLTIKNLSALEESCSAAVDLLEKVAREESVKATDFKALSARVDVLTLKAGFNL